MYKDLGRMLDIMSKPENIERIAQGKVYNKEETKKQLDKYRVIQSDGSLIYDSFWCNRNISRVNEDAKIYASKQDVPLLSNFNQLDENLMISFEKFVQSMLVNDIEVIFFLSPYHPYTYQVIKKREDTKIIIEVIAYI